MSHIKKLCPILFLLSMISCEDFVEVDNPDYKVPSSEVFNSEETALGAMQGIYNQLYQASFSAGWLGSISVLSGLSSDNLEPISSNSIELMEFHSHNLLPNNSYNLGIWTSAYNIIYGTNSLLEGLDNSSAVSDELTRQLRNEAKVIRAFTYFYLVNLYGDVPLVQTTDYRVNSTLRATSKEEIFSYIITDLMSATEELSDEYREGERTTINRYVAMALLARVHLYLNNWELAEQYSSEVIANSSQYHLLEDVNQVFLMNSPEALWQLSPLGAGTVLTNTNEGSVFIINPILPSLSYLKISTDLVDAFSPEDKRRTDWIDFHSGIEVYYAKKYKIQNSTEAVSEYSMVLRVAEQWLIRAEARAQQNKLVEAISDIDKIKQRAGLNLISETNPNISQESLLIEIYNERRKELFTEWGHRWLDLKRTDNLQSIFSSDGETWTSTDRLYPIPEEERLSNPNLSQNPGY